LKRVVGALPFVVGKKVHPPDGTTVVFEVTGSWPTTLAIGVQDGRAKTLAEVPEDPTVTLAMDAEALACLGLGRWDRETVEGRRLVAMRGDDALGRSVLDQMNFLF
jgi:hypothetical protein